MNCKNDFETIILKVEKLHNVGFNTNPLQSILKDQPSHLKNPLNTAVLAQQQWQFCLAAPSRLPLDKTVQTQLKKLHLKLKV